MHQLYFEDFASGQRLPAAQAEVSAEDAARFGAEFDPLAAERRSIDRSGAGADLLPVSHWYVACLGMRMICEAFLSRTAGLGAPGIETMEWPHAVYPGDRLRLEVEVVTVRPSRSRPEMGLVGVELTLTNQRRECVMKQGNVLLVQRRATELAP